jgi:hypothetical protein
MASSYAAVTFDPWRQGNFIDLWNQSPNIVKRHVPGANRDDVQAAGRSNFTMALTAILTASADINTLMTSVGTSGRTLNLEGLSYTGVRLIRAGPVQKLGVLTTASTTGDRWWIGLEFDRDGA